MPVQQSLRIWIKSTGSGHTEIQRITNWNGKTMIMLLKIPNTKGMMPERRVEICSCYYLAGSCILLVRFLFTFVENWTKYAKRNPKPHPWWHLLHHQHYISTGNIGQLIHWSFRQIIGRIWGVFRCKLRYEDEWVNSRFCIAKCWQEYVQFIGIKPSFGIQCFINSGTIGNTNCYISTLM